MKTDFDFFKTSMPESRKADFYLGCLDGSIFLDFNQSNENLISLCRISFDGYGCCNLEQPINYLDCKSSKKFLELIRKDELNQAELTVLVMESIKLNIDNIWLDALEEYGLIDNSN